MTMRSEDANRTMVKNGRRGREFIQAIMEWLAAVDSLVLVPSHVARRAMDVV
jgi:hypothetical protein